MTSRDRPIWQRLAQLRPLLVSLKWQPLMLLLLSLFLLILLLKPMTHWFLGFIFTIRIKMSHVNYCVCVSFALGLAYPWDCRAFLFIIASHQWYKAGCSFTAERRRRRRKRRRRKRRRKRRRRRRRKEMRWRLIGRIAPLTPVRGNQPQATSVGRLSQPAISLSTMLSTKLIPPLSSSTYRRAERRQETKWWGRKQRNGVEGERGGEGKKQGQAAGRVIK